MNIRMTSAAGLMLALAGCTTIPSIPAMKADPIAERWVGKSAGGFFAAYGPPISDHDEGDGRVYNWRGGYKNVKVAARPAADGKKATGARTLYRPTRNPVVTVEGMPVVQDLYMTTTADVNRQYATANIPVASAVGKLLLSTLRKNLGLCVLLCPRAQNPC